MIEGQWLDISYSPEAVTEDSLYEIFLKKTGALILASVLAGAELGGADARGIKALEEYGRNLGLAFQLRDDLLDSSKEAESVVPSHPNATALFGVENTSNRLFGCIDRALAALDGLPVRHEELRHLASMLRALDGEEDHG